ncbi:MAG: rhomboid family intramembrane serine protease [Pseudomonadota bacterium]
MKGDDLIAAARPVLILVIVIWCIAAVNLLLGYRLNHWFGLEPRSFAGLIGVPVMPFLHGGIGHAAANTIPLIFLGALGMLVAPQRFPVASVAIVILSGLATWIFARGGAIHVGASGLIFGWFGYLVALGIIERSARALVGTAIVVIFYGGMIWGVLPQGNALISWEAHLFGALAGAGVAFLQSQTPEGLH